MRIESIEKGEGYIKVHFNHEDMERFRQGIKVSYEKHYGEFARWLASQQDPENWSDREEDKIKNDHCGEGWPAGF